MRISELIRLLAEIQNEHGDITVKCDELPVEPCDFVVEQRRDGAIVDVRCGPYST